MQPNYWLCDETGIRNKQSKMIPVLFILVGCLDSAFGFTALSIGDWGDDTRSGKERQEALSLVMSDWCGVRDCAFIFSSGDNFYQTGIHSADDPRFNTSWRWVYDKPNLVDLTWYMTLGNHDYGTVDDRELYQVNYSYVEPRWVLPWLWYDFIITEPDFSVHFIMVDAMSILNQKYDWEGQLAWYKQTLAESTADYKVVVQHHPPYTFGGYATGSLVHRDALVPAAEQYGVDLFITGHDHNMQHVSKFEPDVDYLISAGGGRGLYEFDTGRNGTLVGMGFESKYFGYHWGFMLLDFSSESVHVDFVHQDGDIVYSYTRNKQKKG